MTPLLTPSGAFDRAAIMRKAWRDYRRVRALGDVEMTLGDWLRNAWKVAKGQRAQRHLDRPVYFSLATAQPPAYFLSKPMALPTIATEAPRPDVRRGVLRSRINGDLLGVCLFARAWLPAL
jgi:hypothetical protein